jgi:hypothetical protein
MFQEVDESAIGGLDAAEDCVAVYEEEGCPFIEDRDGVMVTVTVCLGYTLV